ncbi:MAG: RHS repeat-associated core domain-containing protein [Candidatus Limnocylindrales bacterium]
MTYDPVGRLLTRVDPRGNVAGGNPAQYTTGFAYEAANDLVATTDPLGHVTRTAYDPAGNRTSVTDPNGHTTTYGYDAANHLVSVADALNDVTRYAYDATNDLASRTDANGHVTSYAYDLADRLIKTTDPDGHTWTVAYDPAGNQTGMTDADGNPTAYTYDALNRLTGISYATGATAPVTYTYDANGNRTSMTDGAGTETFTYDALNRLTSDIRGTSVFRYTYDAAGDLLSRTYPDGTLTSYTYDADGRLASAASGGTTSTYAYDAAGDPTAVTTPDGFTTADAYDAAGRLISVATSSSAGLLSSFAYHYDAAGNRTAMVTSRDTMVYTYDAANRLTGVCYSGCGTAAPAAVTLLPAVLPDRPPEDNPPPPGDTFTHWTYDAVGNRLTQTNYLGTASYAYDPADRLTGVTPPGSGALAYTYDANGNQLSAGSSTYAYNLANELVSASVGGTTQTYTYSGDGIRLRAATGGQASNTTQFVVDRAFSLPTLVAERDGNGKLIRRYVYGLDLLSQTTANKGPYWYHHDGLGSITDITSASGTPLWWAEYQPYGLVRASGSTSQAPVNPFMFTGQYQDSPTGLYYLRARQYDPSSGRFLAVDPIPQATAEAASSSYAYGQDDPVGIVDPSGRQPICGIVLVGAELGPIDWGAAAICVGVGIAVTYVAAQSSRLPYVTLPGPQARGPNQMPPGMDPLKPIKGLLRLVPIAVATTLLADLLLRGQDDLGEPLPTPSPTPAPKPYAAPPAPTPRALGTLSGK